jgi:ribosome-associated toxin RatA of RatAB toxin-antitoxin module
MADLEGTYSAFLPVSPKAATEAVLNVADYPKWWSRSVTTSLKKGGTGGKAAVGSILEVKLDKVSFEYEVTKIEPGKRIEMKCVGGSYRGPAEWTFKPEKKGTRVTYHVALDASGMVVRMLGKAVDVGSIHERILTSSLERLAERLAT